MKGVILPDHIPLCNFQLIILGAPLITFTAMDGLEEELEKATMPDRTVASGGNTKATEWTADHPMHHTIEDVFLEAWFQEGQDPVLPTYKKPVTLLLNSISRLQTRSFNLFGTFAFKRSTPRLEMSNEGEIYLKTWSFSTDRIFPT